MTFFRIPKLHFVAVIIICFGLLVLANSAALAAPRSFVDVDIAIEAWKVKPKEKETTAAMRLRTQNRLRKMLSVSPASLDPDKEYWPLLQYLRAYPWEKMPSSWKTFYLNSQPNPKLTAEQRTDYVTRVEKKPIFRMTPKEVDVYIGHVREKFPKLRERIMHLARKNIGQPYRIYLLGEFPNEVYDAQPLYCLDYSDCVVFSEHTYAMALSSDWKSFFPVLQHIRYKDGVVGMTTRNHYTEADWNINNRWLIQDVTNDLGATTVTKYESKIDRAKFFDNFGIGQDVPVETLKDDYIPAEAIPSVLANLKDGDFVNIVRGNSGSVWVGHVGLVGHAKDGTVTFIHSTTPRVKEQPLMEYVTKGVEARPKKKKKGEAIFLGMKFHRLRDDVLEKKLAEGKAVFEE